jgi:hypothetical protein
LLALLLAASCVREGSADQGPPSQSSPKQQPPAAPAKDAPKDPPMPDQPIHQVPPPLRKPPAEDTARYLAWMTKRGTPVKDKAREEVLLRLGDWGFFEHGPSIGAALDRVALDRADHAVVASDKGAWHTLLGTKDLDAAETHKRVAWLFKASTFDPTQKAPKVVPPMLTTASDGTITFQGWLVYPPNMGRPMRLTITATPATVKIVNESPDHL